MPTMDDFRRELDARLKRATKAGAPYVDVNSGELHRELGGYPGANHQMPVCCDAMYEFSRVGDKIITQPPKKKGASLTIRYKLPR